MSPRTKEQFDEIRQRSRANIMDTALELFGTLGYHSTSISRIAKEAGVSKGLMYNYFESKEDLLFAIIQDNVDRNLDWWEEIMALDLPPVEKLRRATARTVEMVQKDFHHWQLLTSLAFQPEVLQDAPMELADMKEKVIEESVALFAAMGIEDPLKETFLYGAFMDGIFLHYMNMGEAYPLEEMIDYFFQRYEPNEE